MVLTKIKLEDFFRNTFAYLVAVDDISSNLALEYKNSFVLASLFELLFFAVFYVFWRVFHSIYRKCQEFNRIVELIKEKKFDKLPEKVEISDECDLFKYRLIKLGEELKTYINILASEAEYYKNKAYIDVLTGVFNRNFLEERAKELFTKFKIQKVPVGVIMLDIDNFKRINDTYGHDVGDLVLKKLAEIIKKNIRKNDYVIRYGGEEFLILLPRTHLEETYKVAEKIRRAVENATVRVGDKEIKFTVSLGVSEIYPHDRTSLRLQRERTKNSTLRRGRGKTGWRFRFLRKIREIL